MARVELWGSQPRVIYLDVSESQLAELQVTTEDILATLALQNMVVAGGSVEVPGKRLRIEATGEFNSPEDIGDLVIRRSLQDIGNTFAAQYAVRGESLAEMLPMATSASGSAPVTSSGELIRLRDVATVRKGYLDPPITQMRFNGEPALAIQLANVPGGNLLETGAALDKRIAELMPSLPAGINVEKFSWQSDLVRESISGFVEITPNGVRSAWGELLRRAGVRPDALEWRGDVPVVAGVPLLRGRDEPSSGPCVILDPAPVDAAREVLSTEVGELEWALERDLAPHEACEGLSESLPVLFQSSCSLREDAPLISRNDAGHVKLSIDLVALTLFFLSRWE